MGFLLQNSLEVISICVSLYNMRIGHSGEILTFGMLKDIKAQLNQMFSAFSSSNLRFPPLIFPVFITIYELPEFLSMVMNFFPDPLRISAKERNLDGHATNRGFHATNRGLHIPLNQSP